MNTEVFHGAGGVLRALRCAKRGTIYESTSEDGLMVRLGLMYGVYIYMICGEGHHGAIVMKWAIDLLTTR